MLKKETSCLNVNDHFQPPETETLRLHVKFQTQCGSGDGSWDCQSFCTVEGKLWNEDCFFQHPIIFHVLQLWKPSKWRDTLHIILWRKGFL